MALMQRVLRPLGTFLTALPATAAGDVPRAGASFAFYRSIDYLPHRDAAWMLFGERMAELADISAAITGLEKVQTAIQALSAGLKPHLRTPANRAQQ